ncbi:MAG: lipid-A-disaccharide synthase [Alphaproteobacteria bacterium]|nr:lipid-A-disaccharide synthase [Alphaproteobacteria bacterium]
MKIYVIAGEPSGDLLGSRFMRAMQKKHPEVVFVGVGGESMENAGLNSLFDISDLAVMGLAEVVPSIPKILGLIKKTVADIEVQKPDVILTIDSWSFGARIQKIIRQKKLGIPQVHYVAPQVWAWKKKRAKTMYKYIDLLLTLLPQEPKYFTPYYLKAECVGHPVIESQVVNGDAEAFRKKYHITENKTIISVLPGSRHNEVAALLPIFLESVRQLWERNPNLHFVIPTVKTVAERVKKMCLGLDLPLTLVEDEQGRYDAFKASSAAIAASGTVALELAIAGVPHIVGYKVSPLTGWLAKKFLHIQFVNLSNIILGREIIPELLQERCVASNISLYIEGLLSHDDWYDKQIDGFQKVRTLLGMGSQTPSEKACDIIYRLMEK